MALSLGIKNAAVRPALVVLTLPITILTLGLFLLVINAGLLGLVAAPFDGVSINGLGAALLGAVRGKNTQGSSPPGSWSDRGLTRSCHCLG
jgi:uncharacterized membrane protein YvlD (DUF360 family)